MFKTVKTLKQHQKKVHEKSETCNLCSEVFNTSKKLECHIAKKHTVERVKCINCPLTFKNKKSLSVHKAKRMCLKDKSLKIAGVKPKSKISCNQCSKEFTSVRGLELHVKTHRGSGSKDDEEEMIDIDGDQSTVKSCIIDSIPNISSQNQDSVISSNPVLPKAENYVSTSQEFYTMGTYSNNLTYVPFDNSDSNCLPKTETNEYYVLSFAQY